MKKLLWIVFSVVALTVWSEVSYQGVALGTPFDEIPFDLTKVPKPILVEGEGTYLRSGKVLDYSTRENWLFFNGKLTFIAIFFTSTAQPDAQIFATIERILVEKYGANQSGLWYMYSVELDDAIILLTDFLDEPVQLVYASTEYLDARTEEQKVVESGL